MSWNPRVGTAHRLCQTPVRLVILATLCAHVALGQEEASPATSVGTRATQRGDSIKAAGARALSTKGDRTEDAQVSSTPGKAARVASGESIDTTLPPLAAVQVIKVRRLNRKVGIDSVGPRSEDVVPMQDTVSAGMDDIVVVVVKNLRSLVGRAECKTGAGKPLPDCVKEKIVLYLDGRPMKGLEPESGAPIPGDSIGTLQFHLARSQASDEAWSDLLGAPPLGAQFWRRPTRVSAGLENGYPVNDDPVVGHFNLLRIHPIWFWVAFATYALIFILFLRYASESDLLRAAGPDPEPIDHKVRHKPYSLARVQMAWWFFWVAGGFFFVFLITRSYDTITTTALSLIGISAGTLLGSSAIDASARRSAVNDLAAKKEAIAALTKELGHLDEQITKPVQGVDPAPLVVERGKKLAHLEALKQQLAAAHKAAAPVVSDGLLNDILSDPEGQSFHRFQMVVWTLVLTALFIVSVYRRLAMPDFNATLLALLGISNGLYLGFKFPEQQAAAATK